MNDLLTILPVMESALNVAEAAKSRTPIYSFIEFVKETSEHLNLYASPANSSELDFITSPEAS